MFLKVYAEARKETFVPFDIGKDYRLYVDGKPRFDGVQSFLTSRGIVLPYGAATDPPTAETVCGVGNQKNELVNEIMVREGVEAYPGSVRAVKLLKERGIKTAVVSSSDNCAAVLRAAKIESLFEIRVDGQTASDLTLAGKPEPDMFLEAARQLGIGIARAGNVDELKKQGADLVVEDLEELLPRRS